MHIQSTCESKYFMEVLNIKTLLSIILGENVQMNSRDLNYSAKESCIEVGYCWWWPNSMQWQKYTVKP